MFKARRISADELEALARDAERFEVTYDAVGATLTGQLPSGFRHDRYELALPDRPDAFARASEGIRVWAAHRGAGLDVAPGAPPQVGATVATAVPVGPASAIALCRIVAVVDETDRFGFAYGTLPGHPERGEEAFVVERVDGRVMFRITVFSEPVELLARLGGPVTRWMQRTTTHRYLEGLAAYVASG